MSRLLFASVRDGILVLRQHYSLATGHGTQGCVLIDKVVIGQRLDSMILEVFSSLNDSVVKV